MIKIPLSSYFAGYCAGPDISITIIVLSFILIVGLLFLVSLICGDTIPSFSKDKVPFLKMVLTVLIIADHLSFYIDSALLLQIRKWGAPIVSVFLFISGFGLVKSYKAKGKQYLKSFWRCRLLKVIFPAIIACTIYLFLCKWPTNLLEDISSLLRYGNEMLPHSWFVEIIVMLYIGFWLSYKFAPGCVKLPALLVWSVAITLLPIALGYDRCWWVSTMAFPAGALYSEYEDRIKAVVYKSKLSYSISLACCAAVVGALYISGNEYVFIGCYVFIPIAIAMIISKLKMNFLNNKVVLFFAGISYEMYLCQGIAMDYLRGKQFYINNDVLYILGVYLFVLLLSFLIKLVGDKIRV